MTALAAERNTQESLPGRQVLPIADNVKIYKGSLVMAVGGYATPGATALGGLAVGRALKTYDNTVVGHALGALDVEIEEGCFWWANGDSIAQADVTKEAWVVDDQTVSKASAGKSPAGVIRRYDATRGIEVESSLALSKAIAAEGGGVIAVGTATLVSGTVTQADTNVTASCKILLSRKSKVGSTALGELSSPTRTAGTSFVIVAQKPADGTTETGDASTVDYVIYEG
jgi:hypothetical protein